jgi:hypothetical protein
MPDKLCPDTQLCHNMLLDIDAVGGTMLSQLLYLIKSYSATSGHLQVCKQLL